MTLTRNPIHWLADDAALRAAAAHWQQADLIALDTEFMRVDTFYPQPALVQVATADATWLLDPLACADLSPLTAVLAAERPLKAMHSCSEDLEVFNRLLGREPEAVLDTQLAAALLGRGFSLGYAALVREELGMELPKDVTRSNWLARPLSAAQMTYAALDVECLYPLAVKLRDELVQLGRLEWAAAEYRRVLDNYRAAANAPAVNRIKGVQRMSPRAYAALVELAEWRDGAARAANVPRGRIAPDPVLMEVARRLPTHLQALAEVTELPRRTIKHSGAEILALVARARTLEAAALQPAPERPAAAESSWLERVRERLLELANRSRIAPELIARRQDLEHIARSLAAGARGAAALPPHFLGWRAELVAAQLEDL